MPAELVAAPPPVEVLARPCDFECFPGLRCQFPHGHAGVHFVGTIDIDAVHRKDRNR